MFGLIDMEVASKVLLVMVPLLVTVFATRRAILSHTPNWILYSGIALLSAVATVAMLDVLLTSPVIPAYALGLSLMSLASWLFVQLGRDLLHSPSY